MATHGHLVGWPLGHGVVLLSFIVYATFRAFYNADYAVVWPESTSILSSFYSPLLVWDGMPSWLSPAKKVTC